MTKSRGSFVWHLWRKEWVLPSRGGRTEAMPNGFFMLVKSVVKAKKIVFFEQYIARETPAMNLKRLLSGEP